MSLGRSVIKVTKRSSLVDSLCVCECPNVMCTSDNIRGLPGREEYI